MSGWLAFWNRPHRIYVNDTHLRVHYRRVADDLIAVVPDGAAAVLDYGCGLALEAARVAERVERLYLYDAAEAVRARLAALHGGSGRIAILDEAGLATLPEGSIDLIMVNSVVQYLSRDELAALLVRARGLLRRDGRLVVADVIPPDGNVAADVASLLRTARRGGFLLAALGGLAATAVSDYGRMRRTLRLSHYAPDAFLALAAEHGFGGVREDRNLGFNPRRMTFTLRPTA
ncbi:SAM-dependent methyltransferase [Constrictibacter sp. MBR-5]|jgi:SAM-dependent methyltransferase|uniref:class I SAM-dependent methyltransferase n=1 Tax=Constrictibacter sp. MBR-5 TaxID=3156467 RepID=UPI00339AC92A